MRHKELRDDGGGEQSARVDGRKGNRLRFLKNFIGLERNIQAKEDGDKLH